MVQYENVPVFQWKILVDLAEKDELHVYTRTGYHLMPNICLYLIIKRVNLIKLFCFNLNNQN